MDFDDNWGEYEINQNNADKSFQSFSNALSASVVGGDMKRYSLSHNGGCVDSVLDYDSGEEITQTFLSEQMDQMNSKSGEGTRIENRMLLDDGFVDMHTFRAQEERSKTLPVGNTAAESFHYLDAEFTPTSINSMERNLIQQNFHQQTNYNISDFNIGSEGALNLCQTRLNQLSMRSGETRENVIGIAQALNLPCSPNDSSIDQKNSKNQWSHNFPNEFVISQNNVAIDNQQQVPCELQEKSNLSQELVESQEKLRQSSRSSHPSIAVAQKGRPAAFPQKLYQMLLDLEKQPGGAEIASFLQDGRAFAIHKPKEFAKYAIPTYFEMTCLASFQRQLNMYNFQQIPSGPHKGAWYHELFIRGQPELYTWMKRMKSTRKTRKQKPRSPNKK